MKNTIFLFIAALFFSAAVQAQTTVDSIKSKYQLQPMPEALTVEKTFPVLGTYQLNTTDGAAQTVTVSLDPESKGIIWIEGLPQGKMKAFLKRSPATYRIVSQKTEDGKMIPEGTLVFDPATKALNVALGKSFNEADPAAIFAMNGNADADVASGTQVKVKTKKGTVKAKEKVIFYSAVKNEVSTTASNMAPVQQ